MDVVFDASLVVFEVAAADDDDDGLSSFGSGLLAFSASKPGGGTDGPPVPVVVSVDIHLRESAIAEGAF